MAKQKLLLVDDDANIRLLAGMSLEDDWDVVSAASGAEALSLAAQEKPDLILLDRMMPGMDGLETLSKLREMPDTKDTPVIFLTAKVQKHEVNDLDRQDIRGVLTKPFDPMTLTEEILKLLDGRASENKR